MRQFSLWLLVFLIRHVDGAESNPYQKSNAAFKSTPKGGFRPNPHVVQVENYRYLQPGSHNETAEADAVQDRSHGRTETQLEQKSPVTDTTIRTRIQKLLPFLRIDHVDRLILRTTLPLSTVFAIIPVVSALDLFWVNRLGDTLAVAGQAAANQVYNSAFWLFAFLPTITATLVSKSHASGDLEQTQDSVCQAMLFSLLIAIPGGMLMYFQPTRALSSILKGRFLRKDVQRQG